MSFLLVVTNRPDSLEPFCNALRDQSALNVECTSDTAYMLESIKGKLSALLVIDGDIEGMSDFSLIKKIISINAMATVSVLSDMAEDQFHDITEGLGILMQLPACPNNSDAKALWTQIKSVAGVLP